jgi:hypothetical protein
LDRSFTNCQHKISGPGGNKVETKGIKIFIDELKKLNGLNVLINIEHKLYGDQSIKCALRVLDDEERLGFVTNGQEIYIYKNEICRFWGNDGLYYFADKIMQIEIKKTK